ncbi:MAG: hypothetical protein ACMUIM_00925 [bacterium]
MSRRDTLLDKLEKQVIDDETFAERFSKVKQELEEVRNRKADLDMRREESKARILALDASYEELVNLKDIWPLLDIEGQKARLNVIVKDIFVRKDGKKLKLKTTLYMDGLGSKNNPSTPDSGNSLMCAERTGLRRPFVTSL